jgi:hypothetical protein
MSDERDVPAREDDSGGQKGWLKRLGKGPKIALGVLTTLASAAAVIQVFFPALIPSQPPPDPVAECRKKHPDAQGHPVRVGKDDYTIEGCRNPGIPGVGDDGHWKAQLHTYGIPGAGLANQYTGVEVYTTDCPAVGLDYLFDNQGTTVHHRMVVQNGQTVSGYTGGAENVFYPDTPDEVQDMSPSNDRLLVYMNGRYQLQTASCEDVGAVTPVIKYGDR